MPTHTLECQRSRGPTPYADCPGCRDMTPKRKTLTYGTLPTREAFDEAFERECPIASVAIANERAFEFTNDPRVGSCALTCSELWAELMRARGEWHTEGVTRRDAERSDAAGQWCSDVLSVLGFEWV